MNRDFLVRFIQLQFGLFLYGLGIAFCLQAHIGYAPWDVFHVGISKVTGTSVGVASIWVGFVVLALVVLLKEPLGIGTIFNMVMVGLFLDFILWLDIIPLATNFPIGLLMLLIGLTIISVAMVFYMRSGFGAGPRDSAMVAFHKKTGLPIALTKGIIEVVVALVGWRMGGMLGIGTVISALVSGFIAQTIFKPFKFDVKNVHHENLKESFERFRKVKPPSERIDE